MRHTYKYLLAASILGLASCGGKKTSDLDAKVAALGEIKTEISSLEEEVRTLRKEIKKLDPNWGKVSSNPVLVEVVTLSPRSFTHNVEVRATVASRKNVQVSSESMGRIVKLNALEGKEVRKGEIIVKIDAEQIRDKMAEVETGLSLAESIYKKQKNLWEKHGIGSEVKFLESKNKYEGLLKQKESLQTQLNLTSVKAPFSGTIDYINVREGELVQPGTPLFRIVSLKDLYLDAQVSEGYIGRIKRGDEARVKFTAIDHTTVAKVKSVSKVIDAKSRTFTVELPIQDVNGQIQPNSLAIAYLPDLQVEGWNRSFFYAGTTRR